MPCGSGSQSRDARHGGWMASTPSSPTCCAPIIRSGSWLCRKGAFACLSALTEVGIKRGANGPITQTIDGARPVGPFTGKRKAFCIIALRAGPGEGGFPVAAGADGKGLLALEDGPSDRIHTV